MEEKQTPVQHILDPDHQDLILSSSDNETFHISNFRASLSSILSQMMTVGHDQSKSTSTTKNPISLTEKSPELLLFFKVLGLFGFSTSYPEELTFLGASDLTFLLVLAEKYGALAVGIFVQQEVICRAMDGRLKEENKFSTRQNLLLFYYAGLLGLDPLLEIAAKLTLRIEDLVFETPDDIEFTLKGHIKPLLKFRRRWEEIKGAICQSKDNLGLSQQDFLAVGECFALREADLRLETVKSTPRLAHKGGVYSTDATISQNYSAKAIQLNSAFQSLRFEEKYVAPKE